MAWGTQDGEEFGPLDEDPHSYLAGDGVTPERVATAMSAIARLVRACPWRYRRMSGLVLEFDDGAPKQRVLHFQCQDPRRPYFVLLDSVRAYREFLVTGVSHEPSILELMPRHVSIECAALDLLCSRQRRELRKHGWEVAGSLVPTLFLSEVGGARSPSSTDLDDIAIVADALAKVRDDVSPRVWSTEPWIDHVVQIVTPQRSLAVRIRGPLWGSVESPRRRQTIPEARQEASFDRDAARLWVPPALASDALPYPEDGREFHRSSSDLSCIPAADRVRLAAFAKWWDTRERETGLGVPAIDLVEGFWMFAATMYADGAASLTEMGPAMLEHVLFDRLTATASVHPDDAAWIVDAVRSFFAFLAVRPGGELAARCLDVLDDSAAGDLARALLDRDRWSQAKDADE